VGYSNFHMFQVRLEKRFASGLQFLSNFQWSKFNEATNRLYDASETLQYRIAGEDRPFRFVFSSTYDLPFGRGKRYGSGTNAFVSRLIGGWQMAGILNMQSGGVVEFGNVIYKGGDLQWNPRNLERAFDITQFERGASAQLDRNRRTFQQSYSAYRTDKINNIDFSVIKAIPIVERVNMQFRVESFNLFNHANFNSPELNPTNANFGRITSQPNLPRTFQLALRLTF